MMRSAAVTAARSWFRSAAAPAARAFSHARAGDTPASRVLGLAEGGGPVKFEYGVQDFKKIREAKAFFVDNTDYIPRLEDTGDHLLFLRPPRFGKSLLASMLGRYYDRNTSVANFHRLFGDTAVAAVREGHNPNAPAVGEDHFRAVYGAEARSFYVLKVALDIQVSGDLAVVERNMNDKINDAVGDFAATYQLDIVVNADNAQSSLDRLAAAVRRQPHGKLYVIVDEYDRFANQLLHDHLDVYKQVVQRNDALSSPLRAFLQTLKNLECHNRTFVTGITPLALADASAANNFKHIYTDNPVFADMLGFRRDDLDAVLRSLRFGDNGGKPKEMLHDEQVDHVLGVMQRFYNGYHFRRGEATLFNPTSCVFFLDKLTENATFRRTILNHQPKDDGDVVEEMSDDNVRGSRSVLKLVASAVGGHDAAQQYAELLASGGERGDAFLTVSKGALKPFRLEEVMTKLRSPRVSASVDLPLALLFYNGLLTCRHDGKSAAEPDKVRLVLPNELTRLLYAKDVATAVRMSVDDLRRLVENPREDTVQELLQGLIDFPDLGPPATFDQLWRESTVATAITTGLRVFTRATNLHVGIDVRSEQNAAAKLYYDVLLETTGSAELNDATKPKAALLLELALVRVDEIVYPSEAEVDEAKGWRFQFDKVDAYLRQHENLFAIEVQPKARQKHGATVEDAMKAKLTQLKEYRDHLQQTKQKKQGRSKQLVYQQPIKAFGVILVGTRFVVRALAP